MTARNHGSSLDTLRWGDIETVSVPAAGETLFSQTKQLVQAHWRWPLAWAVQVSLVLDFGAVITETTTFFLDVEFTVGSGQAKMTYTETFSSTAAAGYPDIAVSRTIPAQDLQIRATVRTAGAVTQVAQANIGCMVAPVTEPHAMTEVLRVVEGQAAGQVEWMREGFTPQPLHYRR